MPLSVGPRPGAPPLKPTLKLYRDLYRMGFSVTFITGRQVQSTPPGPGLTVGKMHCQIFALVTPVLTCGAVCLLMRERRASYQRLLERLASGALLAMWRKPAMSS